MLFEPMWTTKRSGSGLGLAIAREIVIEHGGCIDCMLEVEKGAEFRVLLPVVEAKAVYITHLRDLETTHSLH